MAVTLGVADRRLVGGHSVSHTGRHKLPHCGGAARRCRGSGEAGLGDVGSPVALWRAGARTGRLRPASGVGPAALCAPVAGHAGRFRCWASLQDGVMCWLGQLETSVAVGTHVRLWLLQLCHQPK